VQAQVPVADVARLSAGMPAQVEIEGLSGRRFAGRVERINPSTEPGTRTINVYVSLPNEDALLRSGMFARVALVTSAEAEVPALPLAAVRTDNGTTFVWTVKDGRIQRRLVELGRRDERSQLVEVTGGLSPDDAVLATKFDNLKDGLAAKVISGLGEARVADKDAPRTSGQAN
jgi:RND family efflux transporter MFP subunit